MFIELFLLCIGAFFLFFQLRIRQLKNFPPGPTPLPLFGNLLQLDHRSPLKDLDKFAQQYGSVYSLYIGRHPAVVLTGHKVIREALVTQAVEFAGRPSTMLFSHLTQNKGVIMADFGNGWKEHRRFALTTLRNFGLGKKSMEQRILDEVKFIISHLEESAGKANDPQYLFYQAASNIIATIIFGSRFRYQDKYFQKLVTAVEHLAKMIIGPWAMLYEIAPALRIFPLPFRKGFQYFDQIKQHILKVVGEHKMSRVPGKPRDLSDVYLEEMEKRADQCTTFNDSQMVTLLFDLFLAGTETTSNTLRTLILYLMTHTYMQGSRVCLGESLARMELFLILVTILRRFRLIWPEDAGVPDFNLIYAFLLLFQLRIRRLKNFPPGPTPLPLFGNLLQLDSRNPLKDLDKFAQQYGSVYSLYIGRHPAVVLTGHKVIREALVTQAMEFAGRPSTMLISHLTKNKGVITADFGNGWKEHRRFALTTLRNFGLGKRSMEQRILDEVKFIISHLEESAGKAIDPQYIFHHAASNIIAAIIFGSRFRYQDEYFLKLVTAIEDFPKVIIGPWAMLYEIAPALRIFPLPFRKSFQYFDQIKQHILKVVGEHKMSRVAGKPRDLIDIYLEEMEKRADQCTTFNDSQMVTLLFDLFLAGTETTSNTLRTLTLYLMTHTYIQEQCQQEIDEVLGAREHVTYEDRNAMPYIQAVIHEAQRVGDIAPLSMFHTATTNTKLQGYSIPKGTIIIPYLSSALRDKSQWKFPNEFNPQNFLNENGEFVKPDAFMPFSVGSRACLGENLARMELFLILVTILRRFRLIWPEDAGVPDFNLIYDQSLVPSTAINELMATLHLDKSSYHILPFPVPMSHMSIQNLDVLPPLSPSLTELLFKLDDHPFDPSS
ncbi:cytochrome P450 2B4-like isoform X3 [Paramisgurnus dabryanus]|uniref:cytochrome P450 2B4-like isoform X3 n=1 Tax=Paramisgurnus dabryanus TaxID=90735 RepID=UPI003CCF0243